MNFILDTAHTWFFDSANHELSGALVIRLVEGIKKAERQFVEVGEVRLGPYFPVEVRADSRCVQITFPSALAFFAYDESFDARDTELKRAEGQFLFEAESSSFRKFVESRTSISDQRPEPYKEFLLCCEDRVFRKRLAVPSVQAIPDSSSLLFLVRMNHGIIETMARSYRSLAKQWFKAVCLLPATQP